MPKGKITLLIDPFAALISSHDRNCRHAALETLLARGRRLQQENLNADALRFRLFGFSNGTSVPVAALTRIADAGADASREGFWLRLEPVTLWADMAKVVMTRCGFADLDARERDEIENTVRAVLFREGMNLNSDHAERWTIALQRPLPFEFTPLDDARGRDVADVLPDDPMALQWRRILNEIQMALHACPVNVRRRQQGRIEINSVWFWGGGFMPPAVSGRHYDTVYSDHPVSRGLALLHDCELKSLTAAETDDFREAGQKILIDWSQPISNPDQELQQLEHLADRLLQRVRQQAVSVSLCAPGLGGWLYDRRAALCFWKRRKPLSAFLRREGS